MQKIVASPSVRFMATIVALVRCGSHGQPPCHSIADDQERVRANTEERSDPMLRSMFPAPALPAFPSGHAATVTSYLRYEDVTQDGRLIPIAQPSALAGIWREVLVHHQGHRNALKVGIIPILTRLTINSLEQPIRVDRPIETRLGFTLAHDMHGDEVSRLFMNVWCEIYGIAGKLGRNPT